MVLYGSLVQGECWKMPSAGTVTNRSSKNVSATSYNSLIVTVHKWNALEMGLHMATHCTNGSYGQKGW